jgi:hypothetical protein
VPIVKISVLPQLEDYSIRDYEATYAELARDRGSKLGGPRRSARFRACIEDADDLTRRRTETACSASTQ